MSCWVCNKITYSTIHLNQNKIEQSNQNIWATDVTHFPKTFAIITSRFMIPLSHTFFSWNESNWNHKLHVYNSQKVSFEFGKQEKKLTGECVLLVLPLVVNMSYGIFLISQILISKVLLFDLLDSLSKINTRTVHVKLL